MLWQYTTYPTPDSPFCLELSVKQLRLPGDSVEAATTASSLFCSTKLQPKGSSCHGVTAGWHVQLWDVQACFAQCPDMTVKGCSSTSSHLPVLSRRCFTSKAQPLKYKGRGRNDRRASMALLGVPEKAEVTMQQGSYWTLVSNAAMSAL